MAIDSTRTTAAREVDELTTPGSDQPHRSSAVGIIRSAGAAVGLPLLGAAIVIGGWWLYTIVSGIPTFMLPAPPEVVRAFIEWPSYLLRHARITLVESVLGFGMAVAGGVLLGAAIAHSRVFNRMTYPWLVALNAVPKVALAPLLVMWMGFGMEPKIAMVVLVCFFPIILATVTGLTSTPTELVELARSLDSSKRQTFVKVRLPYALPQVFIGLKVAMPLAVIGAVIGEFAGGSNGLGFVVASSGSAANTPLAFAAIAILSVMSIALFYTLVALERMLLPWVRGTTA